MHHKRGKPKNSRAGCLLCKPHKMNGAKGLDCAHGPSRKVFQAKQDAIQYFRTGE